MCKRDSVPDLGVTISVEEDCSLLFFALSLLIESIDQQMRERMLNVFPRPISYDVVII